MKKTSRIAAGIVVSSIGILIAICEYRHALFLTGCFIAVSGLAVTIENIEQDEI